MDGPRRNTRALAFCAALWLSLAAGSATGQEPVVWHTDLVAAQKLAAQTGRLLLVHVWAPWCGPCQQMERDVLSDPAVKASLAPRFVLVKLNYDLHGPTLQTMNIDLLPSDAILSADGRVLHKLRGKQDANTYVTRLSQLAEQHSAPLVARVPSSPATGPVAAPMTDGAAPMPMETPVTSDPMAPAAAAPMAEPAATPSPMQGVQRHAPAQPGMHPATAPLGLEGFCPVRLCQTKNWVAGDARYALVYQGRQFRFASADELRQFQADPARYAPVAGGLDPVLLAEQRGVQEGRREHGVFWRGQIYLFSSEESLARFAQSPRQYAGALRQAQLGGVPETVVR